MSASSDLLDLPRTTAFQDYKADILVGLGWERTALWLPTGRTQIFISPHR
jgi:hypothetical protein